MRPWLMLPVLLPALWGGVTYAGLWTADAPAWLSSPLTGVALCVIGLGIAVLAEWIRTRDNPYHQGVTWYRREPKAHEEPMVEEPLVTRATPMARAFRTLATPLRALRVDMPEPLTATPAPHR